MTARILATLALLASWRAATALLDTDATTGSAEAAARQFANGDGTAARAAFGATWWSGLHLSAILLVIALVALWQAPLRRGRLAGRTPRRFLMGLACALAIAPAQAFYATTDVTEVVYILPNWSAFFIPDQGANRDTQAAFGSVAYLDANKIAAKRFVIPHAKLSGTGGTSLISGPDYYVPTGRMIIVDRTPYFREWVDPADRGTSARKQGFHFETKDSIDIGTGITVSAYVPEQNAATFLYWFGTRPAEGDLSRPENQFASVLYGQPLAAVMDGIVRAKVQEALANEFGKRPFDTALAEKGAIIKAVADAVRAEFEPKGITIGFIGYAGPLDFSEQIQAAIDRTVIATRDRATADILRDALPVLQARAYIDATGTLAAKWNGQLPALPSVVVVPDALAAPVAKLLVPPPAK